jgi:hypothetical protein
MVRTGHRCEFGAKAIGINSAIAPSDRIRHYGAARTQRFLKFRRAQAFRTRPWNIKSANNLVGRVPAARLLRPLGDEEAEQSHRDDALPAKRPARF